ncbi:MAG: cysteine desulfurase [Roseburia sp.]|nr:cysteine desulfurase [Roseburia sp.]
MEAYLDNAATTRTFDEVGELVQKVMCVDFGNPSSLHKKGVTAERYIREAAERIAATLKCNRNNIIFTSGGTESNNMALLGGAMANRRKGKHIILTCFEHAAVYEPVLYLEEFFGYEVTYLPVDPMGHVDPEELKKALREDTVLVSVMMVNNEVGAVLDIEGLGKVIKEYRKDILFHVDAIQAYGKMKVHPKKLHADLLSASGHKIHGPKGTGFLYVADGVKLHPLIHGGGQQNGKRSGTENVPGIAGLGLAAHMMYEDHEEKIEHLYQLKHKLIQMLEALSGIQINAYEEGRLRETAPHIISTSVEGVKSEVLLHALEEKGVFVSAGSACSSNHPGISQALKAIGVKAELLESTIRFSLSVENTIEELEYAVSCMEELLPVLRRYVRK